jgi:hypothetical protein
MARKASSQWRARAREVIRFVLARLAPGATDDEKHEALSAAYPFGLRKFHPYRLWLQEVRAALHHPSPPAPSPAVAVTDHGVTCGWCHYPHSGGCPVCYAARKRYEEFGKKKPRR